MEKELYDNFITAKRSSNIIEIKKLYDSNPNNLIIKFEYAKLLKKIDLDLAKKILKELIGTSNENFALLELGSIERGIGNYNMSHSYFERILKNSKSNDKDINCATLELGKLEVIMGNKEKAREYFNSLCGTPNECYALLELGKLELSNGDITKAMDLFKKGIGSKCGSYSLLWLGRAEEAEGNYMNALICFNELLNSPIRKLASKEIQKIRKIQTEESEQFKKRTRRKENEN